MPTPKAREWLENHKHLLPKISDGSRINGDPIIYTGRKPPEHIHRQQIFFSDDEQVKQETIAAMERVLIGAGLTLLQLTVLLFRAEGLTQAQIADALGVTRQAVTDIQLNARKRLARYGLAICRRSEGQIWNTDTQIAAQT